jgi:hypothetical protein
MKPFKCYYDNPNLVTEIIASNEEDAACKMAQLNPQGWGIVPYSIIIWVDGVKYKVEPEIRISWSAEKC